MQVTQLGGRLERSMAYRLQLESHRLDALRQRHATLSPRATLARGYAIIRRFDGSVVLRAADVDAGDPLLLEVRDGVIPAQVQDQD